MSTGTPLVFSGMFLAAIRSPFIPTRLGGRTTRADAAHHDVKIIDMIPRLDKTAGKTLDRIDGNVFELAADAADKMVMRADICVVPRHAVLKVQLLHQPGLAQRVE